VNDPLGVPQRVGQGAEVGALVVTGERDRVYEDGACALTPQLNQVGTAGVAESVGAFGVDGDGAVPCRERRRGRSKSLWCANDIGDALGGAATSV
jgi:hypothetical protein